MCALVRVLKLLLSTAPIRGSNRNNNYGHLGLGEIIFFSVIISTFFTIVTVLDFPQDSKWHLLRSYEGKIICQTLKKLGTHTHTYVYTLVYPMQMESIQPHTPLTHLSRQHLLLIFMQTQFTVKFSSTHMSSRQ